MAHKVFHWLCASKVHCLQCRDMMSVCLSVLSLTGQQLVYCIETAELTARQLTLNGS